jgi:hypothetical protein
MMTKAERDFHVAACQKAAASHAKLADCMSKCADSHDALSKSCEVSDPTQSQHHADLASGFKKAAACHVEAGEDSQFCSKQLESIPTWEGPQSGGEDRGNSELKSLVDRLEKMLVPSAISAIPTGDNPMINRIVPRTGQPTEADRKESDLAKSKLSPRLQEVLIGDESRG